MLGWNFQRSTKTAGTQNIYTPKAAAYTYYQITKNNLQARERD